MITYFHTHNLTSTDTHLLDKKKIVFMQNLRASIKSWNYGWKSDLCVIEVI